MRFSPKPKVQNPKRRVLDLLGDRHGQAMVEMALVLPIFILLVTGIVDFGRAYNAELTLTHASREGARYAAVGVRDVDVDTLVKQAATTLDPAKVRVTVSPAPQDRQTGGQVTVTVRYSFEMVTPVIGALVGNPIALNAQTVMRIE